MIHILPDDLIELVVDNLDSASVVNLRACHPCIMYNPINVYFRVLNNHKIRQLVLIGNLKLVASLDIPNPGWLLQMACHYGSMPITIYACDLVDPVKDEDDVHYAIDGAAMCSKHEVMKYVIERFAITPNLDGCLIQLICHNNTEGVKYLCEHFDVNWWVVRSFSSAWKRDDLLQYLNDLNV